MDLPFEAQSFDIVVNIESSHLYPDPPLFFRQANRILRPNGFLLFVDLGSVERMKGLPDVFMKSGFAVVVSRNITHNVIESIRRDSDRRAGILRYCRGDDQYWAYVLKKGMVQRFKVAGIGPETPNLTNPEPGTLNPEDCIQTVREAVSALPRAAA